MTKIIEEIYTAFFSGQTIIIRNARGIWVHTVVDGIAVSGAYLGQL